MDTKIWRIRDETAAVLESFLSWPNRIFTAIWNAICALERIFPIATKTAISAETAFSITGRDLLLRYAQLTRNIFLLVINVPLVCLPERKRGEKHTPLS